jgi:hypothetical protein
VPDKIPVGPIVNGFKTPLKALLWTTLLDREIHPGPSTFRRA